MIAIDMGKRFEMAHEMFAAERRRAMTIHAYNEEMEARKTANLPVRRTLDEKLSSSAHTRLMGQANSACWDRQVISKQLRGL